MLSVKPLHVRFFLCWNISQYLLPHLLYWRHNVIVSSSLVSSQQYLAGLGAGLPTVTITAVSLILGTSCPFSFLKSGAACQCRKGKLKKKTRMLMRSKDAIHSWYSNVYTSGLWKGGLWNWKQRKNSIVIFIERGRNIKNKAVRDRKSVV